MPDVLEFASATARAAGQLLCQLYRQHHSVHLKSSDIDVVTEADIASEQLIVNAIRQQFPDHGIFSEEGLGDVHALVADSTPVWLVDPLDGTVNYAHGYPLWGVSLALSEGGQVLLAVTFDALRDEIFFAQQDKGAWCNGERIQVSGVAELRQALVATGFAYKRATLVDNNLAEFSAVMPCVQGVRRAGAAVLDLAHLAGGRLDGYWEMHLRPWDWAAGWLLVEEAGGKVTDMRGEPWSLASRDIVASNGLLHAELLARLAPAHQQR
jgi:myo-inositol-1(or 4)-monophosphatase